MASLPSIARHAPSIVAGSALAGFGLSFGRDVYRKAKRYWLLLMLLVCLAGVFFSALWLFRNYRSMAGAIFKRLGALVVLAACTAATYAVQATLSADVPYLAEWTVSIYGILFLAGAGLGAKHRRRRWLAWRAEEHNEAFLAERGLEVVDVDEKGNLRLREGTDGGAYRLMDDLTVAGELEFMALGRRGKRAYLSYDETGRYTEWSGLVGVR